MYLHIFGGRGVLCDVLVTHYNSDPQCELIHLLGLIVLHDVNSSKGRRVENNTASLCRWLCAKVDPTPF